MNKERLFHFKGIKEEMETKEDVQKRNAAVAAGGLSLALLLLLL